MEKLSNGIQNSSLIRLHESECNPLYPTNHDIIGITVTITDNIAVKKLRPIIKSMMETGYLSSWIEVTGIRSQISEMGFTLIIVLPK